MQTYSLSIYRSTYRVSLPTNTDATFEPSAKSFCSVSTDLSIASIALPSSASLKYYVKVSLIIQTE